MQTTSDSENDNLGDEMESGLPAECHGRISLRTKLPYKLGSPQDPHFPPSPRASEDLSRTEATAKWYDETFFRPEAHEELMDELINERGHKLMEEQE